MTAPGGIVLLGGDLATVTDLTRRAEAAGFDSVWTTEFYERSAIVSLAAMAHATSRVRIGSAIAYAVGRSPLVLATEARDLDELSDGRLVLGLGTGTRTMQRDWHGADPTAPALRVEELVPLLRRFWAMDGTGIDHEGRFYTVRLKPTADVRPPLRTDIPVQLAGVNKRMIQAAGAVADGLVGHPVFSRKYVETTVRPALEEGARRTGRAADEVTLTGFVICSVHDDTAVARAEAKAQIAFYAVVRTYAPAFEVLGFGSAIAEIRDAWTRRDRAAMIGAVPEELVDLLAVTGPPEEVRQRFTANFADVYDHAMLYSPSFGIPPDRFVENVQATIGTFAV